MLGKKSIQQYFAKGNTHYVTPQVSFEWNYNLFFTPYVTNNGNYNPTLISGTWSNPPTTVASGRTTSVFLNDTSLSTRSCYSFNTTSGSGDSSITIPLSSNSNTYKITFWAKVDRDAQVNLSALAYIDYHRAHSSSQTIDSIMWTKFEIYLSPRPLNTNYSNPILSLHHGATDGTATYGILIDQLEIHQTTDFEYQYGNLWTTSDPFTAFRPGESYVPSGNSLCQLPTSFRAIKTDMGIESGSTTYGSSIWNNQVMPVSPVIFHPTLLGTSSANPVFKNGSLSEWTKYKYFVADSSSPIISGSYDQLLNVNKIVIKFNTAYSTPSSFSVVLNGQTNTTSGGYTSIYTKTITLSNTDIDSSGTCILYYQSNGNWVSGKNGGTWSGTADNTTIPGTPSFDFQGNVKFGGSKGGTVNATIQINSIQVTQISATIRSQYASSTSIDESLNGTPNLVDKTSEFSRMQIIEISPRLEVDVSYYTMSVSTDSELDNKQNPLPISQISSNVATITLSNVPLTVSGVVLSLFSNNSTSSILKGLFKNYVKCYINYRILDNVTVISPDTSVTNSDKLIPGGVYYVDTWDSSDIEHTVVTAYDVSKYLQLMSPTDYVTQTEDAFRMISNVLDFAGFTDYDYDSLKRVTSSIHVTNDGIQKNTIAPVRVRYFYVDGSQQKVFDVLRELFEAYQIAAYVDSYGVMKFINVDSLFDPSNKISTQIHDTSGGVTVNASDGYINDMTILPNIIVDTFTETTRTKVGKATFTYKSPQIDRTIASDIRLLNNNLYVDHAPTFMDSTNAIWDSSIDEATTFNTLANSMGQADTFFTVPAGEATAATTTAPVFRSYGIDHNGYAIIENEIVSFQYKEFSYTNNSGFNQIRSVLNSAEFASQFAEVSGLAGNQPFTVQATGRITNVNRGQFNTPVSSHLVMSNLSDIQSRFDTSKATIAPSISNGNILLSSVNGSTSKIMAIDSYSPGNTYTTFSTKILSGPNSKTSYPTNTSYGLVLTNSSNIDNVFVYITQEQISTNPVKYTYKLYVTQGSFGGTSLLLTPYIDVTKIINNEAKYPLQSPFEDYSKYTNIKFVKASGNSNNSFEIYLNKNHVPLSTIRGISLDTSGTFGAFVHSAASATAAVQVAEVYATQSSLLDSGTLYHYQLPWFSEKIASNKKIFEISWIAQSSPSIVGINYYDIQNTQAPSLDAYPLKLSYNWYYLVNGNAASTAINLSAPVPVSTEIINGAIVEVPATGNIPNLPYISVDENSLNYSPIYHSGFRSRFAIVNCSPSQVWIRKSPDTVNKINVDFSLITNSLISLGDDVVIEKIFDIANINETVDITSSWVQDKNTAIAILRTIYRALEGFSRDTTLSVYGNPLHEIGDTVLVNYKLKNIINQKYIVQGVKQTFDTGLSTILTLNQVGNNAIVKSPNTYIAPLVNALPSNPSAPISPPIPMNPNSGSVGSISGTLAVGNTLSIIGMIPPSSGGTPTYQWQNSSDPASGFSNISGAASSTYTISSSDQNLYIRCFITWGTIYAATGSVGQIPSSIAFTTSPTAVANGLYGFTVSWATSTIPTGAYYSVSWSNSNGDYGTQSPSTSPYSHSPGSNYQSYGLYKIFVSVYNSSGILIASASTTYQSVPLIPGTPTLGTSSITSSGFTANWSASNSTSYVVNLFKYEYVGSTSFLNLVASFPIYTSSTSKVITGLSNGDYQISVYGKNGTISGTTAYASVTI